MNRRRTRVCTILVLVCWSACGNLAIAQPREEPDNTIRARGGMLENLGLSKEQRDKLHDLRENNREMRDQMRKMRYLKESVEEAIRDPEAREQEILKKADELAALQSDLTKRRVQRLLELRKVLTPQQMNQLGEALDDKREQRKSNMREQFRENFRRRFMGEEGQQGRGPGRFGPPGGGGEEYGVRPGRGAGGNFQNPGAEGFEPHRRFGRRGGGDPEGY